MSTRLTMAEGTVMPAELESLTLIDVFLLLVTLGGFGYAFIPTIMGKLGLATVRHKALVPAYVSERSDPDRVRIIKQATRLGFTFAGQIVETAWFINHEWRKSFLVDVYLSADRRSSLSLYRLSAGGSLRLSVESITEAGGLIRVAAPGAGVEADEPNYHRVELPEPKLAALIERHAMVSEAFVNQRGVSIVSIDLAERARIDQQIEQNSLRKMGGSFKMSVTFWLIPALFVFALTMILGRLPVINQLAIAASVGTGCYFVLTAMILPRLLSLMESRPGCALGTDSSDLRES